jgi:uncharacterized protein
LLFLSRDKPYFERLKFEINMPLIEKSSFPGHPYRQFHKHLQTIVPAFRKINDIKYQRERIETADGDFLDLDWISNGSKKLVILTHGLEGNSQRAYMRGMAKKFSGEGWDVLAWNCRSCSGQINRALRLYNHGEIEDIGTVVEHAIRKNGYESVVLIGFSMGGNISLKYAGVNAGRLPKEVKTVVAFSAPLDMGSSTNLLKKWDNFLYKRLFVTGLTRKALIKAEMHPGQIDASKLLLLKDWGKLVEFFSVDINGYKSTEDFYFHGSAVNFIENIAIPSLIVQAQNDPMLSPECMPFALCKNHKFIYLETPKKGGHVGFQRRDIEGAFWSEARALEWASMLIK